MKPQTSNGLLTLLMMNAITRAYSDIVTAAWRKRLTNADIAAIENEVITTVGAAVDASHEFEGFEAEKVVAQAKVLLKEFFEIQRKLRVPGKA